MVSPDRLIKAIPKRNFPIFFLLIAVVPPFDIKTGISLFIGSKTVALIDHRFVLEITQVVIFRSPPCLVSSGLFIYAAGEDGLIYLNRAKGRNWEIAFVHNVHAGSPSRAIDRVHRFAQRMDLPDRNKGCIY